MKYKAEAHPFLPAFFSPSVNRETSALTWWKSFERDISVLDLKVAVQLYTAIASSAGVERFFFNIWAGTFKS